MDNKELQPVMDEVLGFMTSALQTHEADQLTISDLSQKLAQHERVTLEKVAAAKSAALDTNRIPNVIKTMVGLNLVNNVEGEKIAAQLRKEPSSVYDLLVKVAETLTSPSEGQEYSETGSGKISDPDGWFRNNR